MFRLHWQRAASATSIRESGTEYLYWVDCCLARPICARPRAPVSVGPGSAIYGPSTAAQADAQTSDIHRTSVGYRLDTLRHETAYLTPDAPSNQPVALLARGMLPASIHARAAMQNIPFSEPAVLFRKRQIPLNGKSARVLVVDDSRANAEALAASLAIDGLVTQFALWA